MSDGPRIRVLSESVIHRIAAGEVVERPASVVKELVENSLDAEAGRIEVTLEQGGCKGIRVVDDGVGMSPEDLALAFAGHATSKLDNPDDLLAIHTMGFRGEALSSIGAVAQARIISRARGRLEGAEIRIQGGMAGPVTACGAPEGTTVEVRNLFFNTPARQKFLRSPRTEFAHASEALTRTALAFPAVTFHLEHDGRRLLRLTGGVEPAERVRQLFGDELAGLLVRCESETPAMRAFALAAPPTYHRANTQMIYTFLNGRYIRDRGLYRAIANAYHGTLPAGRQPAVFLFLDLDAQRVDVNVHPTKIEVRFREPSAVFGIVQSLLQKCLRQRREQLASAVEPPTPASIAPSGGRTAGGEGRQLQRALSDLFTARPAPASLPQAPDAQSEKDGGGRFVQIHNAYILEETADGIRVIDQHALHERILYEEFSRREKGGVNSQRLLLPQTLELRPRDLALALELVPTLAGMGFLIEEFGGNSIVIQAVPQALEGRDARRVLLDVLDEVRAGGGPRRQEAHERTLRVMACKGAVKAGEPLRPEEIRALLERRDRLGLPLTCPHGRPTTWNISLEDLERRFKRK